MLNLASEKCAVTGILAPVNGNSSLVAVVAIGIDPVQGPASANNATTVKQVGRAWGCQEPL